MSLPATPSQEAWANALVDTWNRHGTLIGAMLQAAAGGQLKTGSDWDEYVKLFSGVRPSVHPRSMLKQSLRPWLATHAKYASDALWDGKPDVAKKLLNKGGRVVGKPNQASMIRKEDRADNRMIISVRARDKRHDWKTVK